MRVPMPFVEPPVDRTLDRSDLGLPAGFLFMFVVGLPQLVLSDGIHSD